jgi:hypothetical protein
MSKTIRLGIELNHVIRNVNKQILKYYQKDIDEYIDIDDVDYTSDVIHNICHFETNDDIITFLYEDYPFEVYGSADQMDRNLSRDLNLWIQALTNQEDVNLKIFFFSMREGGITIQSTYFFLGKIGSRVREMVFPKSCEELAEYGDIFITSNNDVINYLFDRNDKICIAIKTTMNQSDLFKSNYFYESFKDFLKDDKKLKLITDLTDYKQTKKQVIYHNIRRYIKKVLSLFKKKSILNSDNTI